MATTSGPARQNDRFQVCDIPQPATVGLGHSYTLGLLILCGLELGCGTPSLSAFPSVDLSSDRQVLLVTSTGQAPPARVRLQDLPSGSTIAPGIFFRPQGFDHVRLSPDRRHAAFSTVDHHALIGLLDVATMVIQEIDVITEGEVSAFHWSADSQTLVCDYTPASGYRRVKAYDVETGADLVVSHNEGKAATHISFKSWGPQPREVILSVTDVRTNKHRITAVPLLPQR
ncbi:MAG: hypothetical protein AB7P24_09745 [Nitrospira sp.]